MEYLYPGGLPKAMTFSYDDGQVYDRRLVKLFDEAGFKATFHLNSGNLGKRGFVTPEEVGTLYQNHEVACHGVTHRHPLQMTREEWLREVVDYDILPMLTEYWFDDEAKLHRWENSRRG